MADLFTAIYLLMGLLGFHPLQDGDKTLLNDPVYQQELGIDPNCPDCDQDKLKQQFLYYQQTKDGGTAIDVLGA